MAEGQVLPFSGGLEATLYVVLSAEVAVPALSFLGASLRRLEAVEVPHSRAPVGVTSYQCEVNGGGVIRQSKKLLFSGILWVLIRAPPSWFLKGAAVDRMSKYM